MGVGLRSLGGVRSALLLVAFLGTQASAAPCVNPALSNQATDQLRANPDAIVASDSDTRTVEACVRDLTGTDPALAAILVRVAQKTTPRFRTAIAAGLPQAAVACSGIDPNGALLIQQAVARFEDGKFQNAFAAVAGDLSTAAAATAAESSESSVGSVVITNVNRFRGLSTKPGGAGSPVFLQINSSGIAPLPSSSLQQPTMTMTSAIPVSVRDEFRGVVSGITPELVSLRTQNEHSRTILAL
jgi:hypothetical protein